MTTLNATTTLNTTDDPIAPAGGGAYSLDNGWARAAERLAMLQQWADPVTFERFERLGVAAGWRCLEVGGGGGSVADWLCARVGATGRVVATDIDPRFLAALARANLDVLAHDVGRDPLPQGAFDLVHARFLLMHLTDPEAAVRRMAAAVRPGGWLLLEDTDFVTYGPDPGLPPAARELYEKVWRARRAALAAGGAGSFSAGAGFFSLLRKVGCERVESEGRTWAAPGGSPLALYERLTAEQHRPAVLQAGGVSGAEYDAYLGLWGDPSFAFRHYLMVSAWGRRPGGAGAAGAAPPARAR